MVLLLVLVLLSLLLLSLLFLLLLVLLLVLLVLLLLVLLFGPCSSVWPEFRAVWETAQRRWQLSQASLTMPRRQPPPKPA